MTCEDATAEADYYGLEVFGFGYYGRKIPINLAELKDYCPKAAISVSRLHDYAKSCLNPLPRMLIRQLIDSNDDRDICRGVKPETSSLNHFQVKALDLFKCFEENSSELRKCALNFAHHINHVSHDDNLNPDEKVEQVCKQYHDSSDCINEHLESKCSPGQLSTWKSIRSERLEHFNSFLCRFHPKGSESFKNLKPVSNSSHTDTFEFRSIIMALTELYQPE